jgi:potassium efflux system protein
MTWTDLTKAFADLLNSELFELEGYPISLARILSGLFLFALSYVFSRRFTRAIDNRLLSRLNMDIALRSTFQNLIFYFLYFICSLFVLRTLHVPLTIFTVLGGALAVGIGFGSQNLVNNFISGILVMAERPFRVGDFIEVDGISGVVQMVGIRSTKVRAVSNALVIVPNTTFIEKNLINWTSSGNINCIIKLGVAYGSDLQRLRASCFEVVCGVAGVDTTEPPWLNFIDFADSALLFDLGFQIPAHQFTNRRAIESMVRFGLNDAFVREGISIPFPQREVQVRWSKPPNALTELQL